MKKNEKNSSIKKSIDLFQHYFDIKSKLIKI
jgi:hypothetical protein